MIALSRIADGKPIADMTVKKAVIVIRHGLAIGVGNPRRAFAQQVFKTQMQHIARIRAQGQRARALAVAQPDLSGLQSRSGRTDAKILIAVIGGKRLGVCLDRNDVAAQRIYHPIGIKASEAVIDQHLVQCDDIGAYRAPERLWIARLDFIMIVDRLMQGAAIQPLLWRALRLGRPRRPGG